MGIFDRLYNYGAGNRSHEREGVAEREAHIGDPDEVRSHRMPRKAKKTRFKYERGQYKRVRTRGKAY